jgi:hypothetical protein
MKNAAVKNSRARPPARPQSAESKLRTGHRTFRTQVAEGDVIQFAPTGEQLRVTKIEADRITFEKLP